MHLSTHCAIVAAAMLVACGGPKAPQDPHSLGLHGPHTEGKPVATSGADAVVIPTRKAHVGLTWTVVRTAKASGFALDENKRVPLDEDELEERFEEVLEVHGNIPKALRVHYRKKRQMADGKMSPTALEGQTFVVRWQRDGEARTHSVAVFAADGKTPVDAPVAAEVGKDFKSFGKREDIFPAHPIKVGSRISELEASIRGSADDQDKIESVEAVLREVVGSGAGRYALVAITMKVESRFRMNISGALAIRLSDGLIVFDNANAHMEQGPRNNPGLRMNVRMESKYAYSR